MPRQRLPSELGPAFSVSAARELGVGPGRLRGADLVSRFHGTRSVDTPEDVSAAAWAQDASHLRRRIDEYRTAMPEGSFFIGPTAAFLHGLPLPRGLHERIHVGVRHPRTASRRKGVDGIQILSRMVETTMIEGMPVADAATTWASLGRTLELYDLVAVADAILRVPRFPGGFRPATGQALASAPELAERLASGRWQGAPILRPALERARTGSSSRPETWIRLILTDAGLPEPVLDHDVFGLHGEFLGCSELAYPHERVAIEYESDRHLTRAQLERDIDKYTAYAAAGWRTIRVTGSHVFRYPRELVRRVAVARRGSSA